MSDPAASQPAKPGTACLGCRRRKLKCSREPDGCANCTKADLPCVYPAPESGVKRKRGPYKKDKPARERHLEDLVRYLEPKANASHTVQGEENKASPASRPEVPTQTPAAGSHSCARAFSQRLSGAPPPQVNSEDLVKDALIALTKSCGSNKDSRLDSDTLALPARHSPPHGPQSGLGVPHPPVVRILECWTIFVARVDPLTKIIHCPTVAKRLFTSLDRLLSGSEGLPVSNEVLFFTIYFSAIRSMTGRECIAKFGETQSVLLERYGNVVEKAVVEVSATPELEALQALVIYVICLRRQQDATNSRPLFTIAVRMAQQLGLHEDPGEGYLPFDAEMRRRLWWALCGLESRGAEDGGARRTSLMATYSVQLPANINDVDLDPKLKLAPYPRVGITHMTWPLLRSELHRFGYRLWSVRRQYNGISPDQSQNEATIRAEQEKFYQAAKTKIESQYIQYFHYSRPYDWMCASFALAMLLKGRLIIEHPECFMPCKETPVRDRTSLLQACVDIIQGTHVLGTDERMSDWGWFYRGFVQWNCLAIVIGELGQNTNQAFSDNAWTVLDPILVDWDAAYATYRGDAAWDHVNSMIERARQSRRQRLESSSYLNSPLEQSSMSASQKHPTSNLLADPLTARLTQRLNSQIYPPFPGADGSDTTMPFEQLTPQSDVMRGTNLPGSENFNTTTATGTDFADVQYFDSFDGINFEAFDEVFGNGSWDFLEDFPSTDGFMDMPI